MITADGGGSNGSRVHLWKIELQKLANELKVPITVCHLPPDTNTYPKGIKISNDQLDAVNLSRHSFYGNWNYTIAPKL